MQSSAWLEEFLPKNRAGKPKNGMASPHEHQIRKIVSGGQTGVDRGALRAAISLGIEHGGWCPAGRLAEDGPIAEIYKFKDNQLALDRWGALDLINKFQADGLEVVLFAQTFGSMGPPSIALDRYIKAGTLKHGGNSVLNWQAANVSIIRNSTGMIRPIKSKPGNKTGSQEAMKVDGFIAMIMGIGRMNAHLDKKPSAHETRGLRRLGPDEPGNEQPDKE